MSESEHPSYFKTFCNNLYAQVLSGVSELLTFEIKMKLLRQILTKDTYWKILQWRYKKHFLYGINTKYSITNNSAEHYKS
jgi:hypothetical protein